MTGEDEEENGTTNEERKKTETKEKEESTPTWNPSPRTGVKKNRLWSTKVIGPFITCNHFSGSRTYNCTS